MIIHKNDNLFGLGEDFHIRQVEGGLRVNRTTIPRTIPQRLSRRSRQPRRKARLMLTLTLNLNPKSQSAQQSVLTLRSR